MSATTRRRVQGVAFIVVVLALIAATIAQYQGLFDTRATVVLRADRTGNQLQERSDVKVRGLIVGQVAEVHSSGDAATVDLLIERDMLEQIPSNVRARLLPKTLFGEKFVSLVLPRQPGGQTLSDGDVIAQDRSRTAIELTRVLDGLLPVLSAVSPAKLASTLNAMSQALEGRGTDVGETLVLTQRYVNRLNTALPDLQADISLLADVANSYAEAAPDLLGALAALTTTTGTVVEQRQELLTLYQQVGRASNDLRAFLHSNRNNIISLTEESRPILELLDRYSPEYPCLLDQIAGLVPRLDEQYGAGTNRPGLHLTIEVTVTRGPYVPGDEPEYADTRGPRCYPAPPPNVNFPQYPSGGPIEDGSSAPPAADNPNNEPPPDSVTMPQSAPVPAVLPNSPAEQRMVAELVASANGMHPSEVPEWSTFLIGPLLRGTVVTLR